MNQLKYIKQYYGKLTRRQIAFNLNIKENFVKTQAKKLGLTSNLSVPRNKINDNSFSKKTMLSCYWAGFIAADGCISNNELRVCLSKTDLNHLIKLKFFLKSLSKITCSKTTTNVYISCNSKKIVKNLYDIYNITPRKSLTLKSPNNLTYLQSLAYIIGYIDGDGCISYNGKYIRLRIMGTINTLEWINFILKRKSKPVTHCKSKIFIISFKKLYAQNLYKIAKQYKLPILDRKWNKLND